MTRTGFGLPDELAFDVLGVGGRAAFDPPRPAEYLFDDAQPDARTRGARQIIAGPNLPYFAGGVPMEAPGVGASNADNFTYQARAFLDQVAQVAEPLPACATFANALRTMEIIRAVVQSSQSGGAAVTVPPVA